MGRARDAGRTWSTLGVPQDEQFAIWRAVASEAFVAVELERLAGEGAFPSTVAAQTAGPIAVSRIASEAQLVRRTEAGIHGGAGDVFFLNLPLSGGAWARQGAGRVELAPGDFVLVDAARPFELGFERPFEQVSLALPHDVLAPLFADPAAATGVRVPGDRGVGAVASAAVRELARAAPTLDREAAEALSRRLADLIALAVGGVQAPPPSSGRAVLLQAALDAVERALGDADLAPPAVADRIGVSTRYLHRLFAERGTTFGRWLLQRRLERARDDLLDPARRHWTVAQVARTHGFRDPSHFARAYRARFGHSPRQARLGGG